MTMADLGCDAHGLAQVVESDPVEVAGDEAAGEEFIIAADGHLAADAVDLDDVERRAGGDAQSLALADGEVVNAVMTAEDAAIAGDEFAGGVRELLALLGEIRVNEALVVAAGDEADLLRVGLFRQRQAVLAGELAHLRLAHFAQRKARAAELLLREAKKKVRMVLGGVGGAAQKPAVARGRKFATCVVAGSQQVSADLSRGDEKLIELQVVVAQAARDGRASGKILAHEGANHVALKALLVVDDVERDAQLLGDGARVVHVVD